MRKMVTMALTMLVFASFAFATDVTFTVNMTHQIAMDNFDPASDYVDIAGDMNGWGPAAGEWQLAADAENNAIWTATFSVDPGTYGFKFRINSSWDAGQHDGGDNRTLVVGDDAISYYGYLDRYAPHPVIHFVVDMADQIAQGNFDPASDFVDVAGSFTSWGDNPITMTAVMGDPSLWEVWVDQADLFVAGTAIEYKYRINGSWDTSEQFSHGGNRSYSPGESVQHAQSYWQDYDYNLAVTFEVNMNAQIDGGTFAATDSLDIAGNFNGWGSSDAFWLLTDDDADGIYTLVVADSFEVGQSLEFKFRINRNWDTAEFPGGSNRTYTVVGGAQTYSVWWNDFDPNFVGAPVTFSVNMNAQIDGGLFVAAEDAVLFESGTVGTETMTDDNADGIYEVTVVCPLGQTFFHYSINGDEDESLPYDRSVLVETADTPVILETVWFSNVQSVSYGEGNITFRVDMQVLEDLGFYNRTLGDSLELRGGVNGWGSDEDRTLIDMIRQPGTEIYFLTVPFEGYAGDNFPYKFFLNLHQTPGDTAAHAGEDFYEYELPSATGGGDRYFTWHGMNADTVMPIQTFQDYVTEGVIPEGSSVTATLYMDMTQAMALEDTPFDPATDDLYFLFQDAWGAELQGIEAGNVPTDTTNWQYVPAPEMGENMWKATVTIEGPAPHALMYTTRYVKEDGTEISELGSGYGYGRFRTQWLKPAVAGEAPYHTQELDPVLWSNVGTPLEVEPEPYANDILYVPVSVDEIAQPTGFVLSQNYPNPFNPTTMISFVVPQVSNVDLVVFDVTGREVARLLDGKSYVPGRYDIMWNGLNTRGEKVASGMYFYQLKSGDFEQTMKMLLLK